MTAEELRSLKVGDIIRHKRGSDGLVVTANYGDHCVAVRTRHVSNPSEWDLISPEPREWR